MIPEHPNHKLCHPALPGTHCVSLSCRPVLRQLRNACGGGPRHLTSRHRLISPSRPGGAAGGAGWRSAPVQPHTAAPHRGRAGRAGAGEGQLRVEDTSLPRLSPWPGQQVGAAAAARPEKMKVCVWWAEQSIPGWHRPPHPAPVLPGLPPPHAATRSHSTLHTAALPH